jgi:NACalpha-BTF3-like transcription factor
VRSDIYLIDHAWTTTAETARQQLKENPTTLLERVENLMGIEAEEGWVDEDDDDDDVEHDDAIISMVAEQANVSYEKAKQALIDENYEVVNAIAVSETNQRSSSSY